MCWRQAARNRNRTMTDTAKAVAFATHCLKWKDVWADEDQQDYAFYVCEGNSERFFDLHSAYDLESVLQEFLGTRYFIQINRGTNSLFHWRVIIGWQDRVSRALVSTTRRLRERTCGTAS